MKTVLIISGNHQEYEDYRRFNDENNIKYEYVYDYRSLYGHVRNETMVVFTGTYYERDDYSLLIDLMVMCGYKNAFV